MGFARRASRSTRASCSLRTSLQAASPFPFRGPRHGRFRSQSRHSRLSESRSPERSLLQPEEAKGEHGNGMYGPFYRIERSAASGSSTDSNDEALPAKATVYAIAERAFRLAEQRWPGTERASRGEIGSP